MLDTNILIYLLKGKAPGVAQRMNALATHDRTVMSFVTWAELLLGAARSTQAAKVMRQLDGVARHVPVLYPQGPGICRHYADLVARLRAVGQPIGGNDAWIASHALAEAATLVTHNTREFARVPGLALEDWV
ncbi:MAG: type II toxin-antitoxin system VapC family toxin [Proteobacteria bacterium]|nr:type II toxin-antitoxin system VapC family toxin [Pseudomonadota bacterium]